MNRQPTGNSPFDYLVKGGLKHGNVYLLAGPPGSSKSTICSWLVTQWVKEGKDALVAAIGPDSHRLQENLSQQGLKDNPKIHFLFQDSHPDLSSLAESMTREAEAHRGSLIVFDSVTPAIGPMKPSELVQSFDGLLKALKKTESITLLTLESGMHDKKVVSTLCYLVDGAFYVRLQRGGKQLSRQIIIRRLRGMEHNRDWHILDFYNDRLLVARTPIQMSLLKLSLAPPWKVMLGTFLVTYAILYVINFVVTDSFGNLGRGLSLGFVSGIASGLGSLILNRLQKRF